MTVLVVVAIAGCGKDVTPTGPGVPVTATVTGLITGPRPGSSSTVDNASIEVIEGPGAGTKATSDRDGRFTLSVPPGSLRLRVSRYNFKPWESKSLTAVAEQALTVPTVLLSTAPWALSGRVTDSLGRPFAGVKVYDATWFSSFAPLTTDADGRYRIASTQAHHDSVTLKVSGTAVDTSSFNSVQSTFCCAADGDTVFDIRVPRVIGVQIIGPSTIRVGETVEMPAATISYDNDATRSVYLLLTSKTPDVATTGPGFVIRALTEGTATLVGDFEGVLGTVEIRVVR